MFQPGLNGGPSGDPAGFQDATATALPSSRAVTESVPTDITLIALDGARTEATAKLEGRVREAHAVVTADQLRVFGGLFTFDKPRWEATARTGDQSGSTGSFTFERATVLGFPRSAADAMSDLAGFKAGLEQLLAPLGVVLDLPQVVAREDGLKVTPMGFRVVNPPFGTDVLLPFLGQIDPLVQTLRQQAVDADCKNQTLLTVIDVVLGVLGGSGAIEILAGGVDVATHDTDYSVPPPAETTPPAPETAGRAARGGTRLAVLRRLLARPGLVRCGVQRPGCHGGRVDVRRLAGRSGAHADGRNDHQACRHGERAAGGVAQPVRGRGGGTGGRDRRGRSTARGDGDVGERPGDGPAGEAEDSMSDDQVPGGGVRDRLFRGYGPLIGFTAVFLAVAVLVPSQQREVRVESANATGAEASADGSPDAEVEGVTDTALAETAVDPAAAAADGASGAGGAGAGLALAGRTRRARAQRQVAPPPVRPRWPGVVRPRSRVIPTRRCACSSADPTAGPPAAACRATP